jgi:translation initiation factor 1
LRLASRLAHDFDMVDRVDRGNGKGRLVYSTGVGRVCPGCGWPERDCKCSTGADAPVPARPGGIVAKLRMEKKGRGGKVVTVVDGLPQNAAFLKELSQELKRACGTGGTAAEGAVELQGDLRDRVRELLLKKGFVVKG